MTRKAPNMAYVVFRGRKPGIYYTWPDCQAQVDGFPKGMQRGYKSVAEAEMAWAEWERKVSYKVASFSNSAPSDSENTSRPWSDPMHLTYWTESPALPPRSSKSAPASTLKRPANIIDLTNDLDGDESPAKRYKPQSTELQMSLERLPEKSVPVSPLEEKEVQLSEEQDKVLKMALRRDNIFLTGAAGCGKTVTLKAILRGLRKKRKQNNKTLQVQVIAPTGIAALPLDGKTTFSFAGVSWIETPFAPILGVSNFERLCM